MDFSDNEAKNTKFLKNYVEATKEEDLNAALSKVALLGIDDLFSLTVQPDPENPDQEKEKKILVSRQHGISYCY